MDTNFLVTEDSWGTETLLPSSLELLRAFDNDLNKSFEIDAIFKRLIEESLELERREQLERQFADLDLDVLNDFSSDGEDSLEFDRLNINAEKVEGFKSEVPVDTSDNLPDKSNSAIQTQEAVNLDPSIVKLKVAACLNSIKSDSGCTNFNNILSEINEIDRDNILDLVLKSLPEDQILRYFRYLSDLKYDSRKFWERLFTAWFLTDSNNSFALEVWSKVHSLFQDGSVECFVIPVIRNIKQGSDPKCEVVKNIYESLSPEQRTLCMKKFLTSLTKEFEMAQFDLLLHFIDSTEFDSDLTEAVVILLESKIVEMKNNRQMGLVILACMTKISSSSQFFTRFSEVSSKFLGTMRFRIAQALKRKSASNSQD